jgi:Dolichyl-phosphate-mannose-protein mannosyltransferase
MTAVTAGRPARLRAASAAGARWNRPALTVLLAATALLYLAGLSRNGWANDFYSAAVQAGAKSWKAFFFGSFDASNFITVDKTPASMWVMEISARLFGLNYWSVLVPQALEGVGSVALLYAAVRRPAGLVVSRRGSAVRVSRAGPGPVPGLGRAGRAGRAVSPAAAAAVPAVGASAGPPRSARR